MGELMVTFDGCVVNTQERGSDDEHMVSRLHFRLQVEDNPPIELGADITQAGSSYDKSPLQVGWPTDHAGVKYKGPFNYEAWREHAEDYYRVALSKTVRLGSGATMKMKNCEVKMSKIVKIQADDSVQAW